MNLIAAVDLNWAIGRDGDQLCYIPADLKRFQALTTGHPVILGRKTLATFPGGRPLKNRRNLILSRDPSFAPEGAEVFRSLEALRAAAPADSFITSPREPVSWILPVPSITATSMGSSSPPTLVQARPLTRPMVSSPESWSRVYFRGPSSSSRFSGLTV